MIFKVFTLYPQIFDSFLSTSLIARAGSKDIIKVDLINWKENFGVRGYKQVDDKPYGGGSGMVLQVEPVYNALVANNSLSPVFKSEIIPPLDQFELANNLKFVDYKKQNSNHKKATILLTPRGYPITQKVCEWLASDFDELTILCGRFEGFDQRVHEMVDLELSIGDFVLNGGEVACMCLIEGVSRLVPDFVTKSTSVSHDSFSSSLNRYEENEEYVKLSKADKKEFSKLYNHNLQTISPLFDEVLWKSKSNQYEHPQYTRPLNFLGREVPSVLLNGNHADIFKWRLGIK
jgi:tRNA (guanine37-N1)-methyltransferase